MSNLQKTKNTKVKKTTRVIKKQKGGDLICPSDIQNDNNNQVIQLLAKIINDESVTVEEVNAIPDSDNALNFGLVDEINVPDGNNKQLIENIKKYLNDNL